MQNSPSLESDTLQLWFTRVSDLTVDEERNVQTLFSQSEIKRLGEITNIGKRREYLLSRALMRHALAEHGQTPCETQGFVERSGAMPRVPGLPQNIRLSLSHSHGLICLAISSCRVGIDVEVINRQKNFSELAKTFMNDDELACMNRHQTSQIDYFYQVWCAKEAFFKALPKTEQAATSLFKLSHTDLVTNRTQWRLLQGTTGDSRVAAVLDNKPRQILQSCFLLPNTCAGSFCNFESTVVQDRDT